MIFVYDRVENIVGKGENAGYQHFLLFPQDFQRLTVSRSLKLEIAWVRVNRQFPVFLTRFAYRLQILSVSTRLLDVI